MNAGRILIVGGRGQVGSQIARNLREQGVDVVVATSQAAGSGQVQLNLVTGEGVHAAFDGVDRAFFLAPPGYVDHYALLAPLIQEAKRRGLKKVVLMTSMGANTADTPFRRAEVELEKSGLNYNIIRPNWFMENFNTFWLSGLRESNGIFLPAGTARTSFISIADIAAVATRLLLDDRWNGRDFDLTGPAALDHAEVAQILSRETGRELRYQDIGAEDFLKSLKTAGVPGEYAEFLGLIMGYLKAGYNAAINDNVQLITGQAPRAFSVYAREHRADFQ